MNFTNVGHIRISGTTFIAKLGEIKPLHSGHVFMYCCVELISQNQLCSQWVCIVYASSNSTKMDEFHQVHCVVSSCDI